MSSERASMSVESDSGLIAHAKAAPNRQSHSTHALRRVAVDLTPLLVGPDNGGAGLLATTLVSKLSEIAPDCEFVLLTSAANHDALEALDQSNTRRVKIQLQKNTGPQPDLLSELQDWV